jgi:hypothetical protein
MFNALFKYAASQLRPEGPMHRRQVWVSINAFFSYF